MNGLTEMHADFFSEFKGNRYMLLDTIEAIFQLKFSATTCRSNYLTERQE
ncbi:hypothetical protein KESI111651_13720 [Kerstersia similis]